MEKENKELCKKCGGFCCIKSGCDYSAKDFDDLRYDALYNILMEDKTSIVAFLSIEKNKFGREYVTPFLYLRARNTGRDAVDLLSFKTKCSLLTENGCEYDASKRPSGGLNLIPAENGCYPLEDPLEIVMTWKNYQKVLAKLVKRITGKSVEKQLECDIEKLFNDILNENLENVTYRERHEIGPLVTKLAHMYPSILHKSISKKQSSELILQKK